MHVVCISTGETCSIPSTWLWVTGAKCFEIDRYYCRGNVLMVYFTDWIFFYLTVWMGYKYNLLPSTCHYSVSFTVDATEVEIFILHVEADFVPLSRLTFTGN